MSVTLSEEIELVYGTQCDDWSVVEEGFRERNAEKMLKSLASPIQFVFDARHDLKANNILEEAIVFAYTHESADVVGLDDDRLAELLDFAGAEKLRAAGDPLPSELYSGAFTIYRGEAGSVREDLGLSWTLDINYAKHFAKRRAHLLANGPWTDIENPVPVVLRTEVTAAQVLFYNEDESEVVVRLNENAQPEQVWSLPDEDEAI